MTEQRKREKQSNQKVLVWASFHLWCWKLAPNADSDPTVILSLPNGEAQKNEYS